jgi:hypothetical protein
VAELVFEFRPSVRIRGKWPAKAIVAQSAAPRKLPSARPMPNAVTMFPAEAG